MQSISQMIFKIISVLAVISSSQAYSSHHGLNRLTHRRAASDAKSLTSDGISRQKYSYIWFGLDNSLNMQEDLVVSPSIDDLTSQSMASTKLRNRLKESSNTHQYSLDIEYQFLNISMLPRFVVISCLLWLSLFQPMETSLAATTEIGPSNAVTAVDRRVITSSPPPIASSSVILSQESPDSKGKTSVTGEVDNVFRKGKQLENDGEFAQAQQYFEQVIEVEPNFVYAWSSLGNVLTAQGNLKDAILCYKKSLSLSPPNPEASVVLLNKAAIELSTNDVPQALFDLDLSRKLGGADSKVFPLKAVGLSYVGKWQESCETFSRVISSGDRDALPWWLRYSMSLLETSRGMEAVAYLQRTLNRFPYIDECNAFATALYTSLGSPLEAKSYWSKIPQEERSKYLDDKYLDATLHWGPKSRESFKLFLSKYNS